MMAVYDAIITRLAATVPAYPVYLVEAPSTVGADGTLVVPTPPYIIIWGPSSPSGGPDDRLEGSRADLNLRIGVTTVAGTPAGVLSVQQAVRLALCPGGRPTRLGAAGWDVWLTPADSRDVQVDREVVFAGSSSHPAYGVDIYTATGTPI